MKAFTFSEAYTHNYTYIHQKTRGAMAASGWKENNSGFNIKKKVTMQVICTTELKLTAMKLAGLFFVSHEHYAISFKLNQAFSSQKQLSCA